MGRVAGAHHVGEQGRLGELLGATARIQLRREHQQPEFEGDGRRDFGAGLGAELGVDIGRRQVCVRGIRVRRLRRLGSGGGLRGRFGIKAARFGQLPAAADLGGVILFRRLRQLAARAGDD